MHEVRSQRDDGRPVQGEVDSDQGRVVPGRLTRLPYSPTNTVATAPSTSSRGSSAWCSKGRGAVPGRLGQRHP